MNVKNIDLDIAVNYLKSQNLLYHRLYAKTFGLDPLTKEENKLLEDENSDFYKKHINDNDDEPDNSMDYLNFMLSEENDMEKAELEDVMQATENTFIKRDLEMANNNNAFPFSEVKLNQDEDEDNYYMEQQAEGEGVIEEPAFDEEKDLPPTEDEWDLIYSYQSDKYKSFYDKMEEKQLQQPEMQLLTYDYVLDIMSNPYDDLPPPEFYGEENDAEENPFKPINRLEEWLIDDVGDDFETFEILENQDHRVKETEQESVETDFTKN